MVKKHFMEKELWKTNQKEFRIEKVIKRKSDKLYVKWKGYDSSFNSWIDKKKLVWFYWLQFHWLQLQWIQFHWMQFHCIKMSQYFLKPYEPFGGDINVKVHLSNYATKADIKNVSYVDTLSFELKTNLASLKTKVDKLDMDNVVLVPVNLIKLSDILKNDVVKRNCI